jgi:dihydroorotate dehydrogenase
MIYKLSRPLLFCLEPERSHHLALTAWSLLYHRRIARKLLAKRPLMPCTVMGIRFPNPVGLAAGLDKDAQYVEALAGLGFGFIEVGTVTPRAQAGNPRPRLFRLPGADAIINRMGFNNRGIDHLIGQVKKTKFDGVLGINIGKNLDTPVERAIEDYLFGLRKVYAYADYVTINISSPNTPGLRDLQYGDTLQHLLEQLKQEQAQLATTHQRYVPLTIKVAPDLHDDDIENIAHALLLNEVDGLIATNTTATRHNVEGLPHADEAGGLSGAPLMAQSTRVVQRFSEVLTDRIPIIAVGGIMSAEDAWAKLEAGASLIQLYTGLIYRGPGLVHEIVQSLKSN